MILYRHIRTALGLSLESVANHLGLTKQAVAAWEAGDALPSAENRAKIETFYAEQIKRHTVWLMELYRQLGREDLLVKGPAGEPAEHLTPVSRSSRS